MRKSLRFAVLERDHYRCRYCGANGETVVLHVDHIHPKSKGGPDELDNLVTACFDCNMGKKAKVLRAVPRHTMPTRRYNLRTPARDVDMEALRVEYPEGSHCATPLKIAAIGRRMGLASYPAAHRYVAALPIHTVPIPPMRKADYPWFRIVALDDTADRQLAWLIGATIDGTYTPWFGEVADPTL